MSVEVIPFRSRSVLPARRRAEQAQRKVEMARELRQAIASLEFILDGSEGALTGRERGEIMRALREFRDLEEALSLRPPGVV